MSTSPAAKPLRISDLGLGALKRHEGVRLKAYQDSGGRWTIGVGHLLLPAELPPEPAKLTWTQQQVTDALRRDVATAEAAVNNCGVRLTQLQFDALVSLAYNIGANAFAKSDCAKRLRAGHVFAAADAILNWRMKGVLLGRRQEERAVFLFGTEIA